MSKTPRPAHAPSHPIHALSCRDMPWHVRLPTRLIRFIKLIGLIGFISPPILLKFLIYKETTPVTLAIDTENP